MAAALDIHWTTLSRWERGVAEPRLHQLWQVARLYLDRVLTSQLWATGPALPERRVRRSVVFCGEQGSPGVAWFVRDALARRERVNTLVSGDVPLTHAWRELTAGAPIPDAVLHGNRVQCLPLDSVLRFAGGRLDVRRAFAAIVREEEIARREGFSGVAWLGDCRSAFKQPEVQGDIMSLERLTECLARDGSSRGLVLYPAECANNLLMACLLCSHRWVVSGAGPVHNAFHNDPSLCLARLMKEAADGGERGDQGEEARSRVRLDCNSQ